MVKVKQQGVIFNDHTGELWRAEWTWFNISLLIRSSNFQGSSFEHDVDFTLLSKYSPWPLMGLSLSLGLSEKSAIDLGNHESYHFSYLAIMIAQAGDPQIWSFSTVDLQVIIISLCMHNVVYSL